MPRTADPARQLEETITQLQEKRQSILAELARIDATFERFGIQISERRGPGRPRRQAKAAGAPARAGRARRGRRKRGAFAKSGHESILDFVRSRGDKGATTSEINAHWQAEGRAGSAYVTLGHLTKQKKLKRQNLKNQRGSRYVVA